MAAWLCPATWLHACAQDPPVTEAEKDIDILFYGWIVQGSRRNKMLDELRFERNVSIHVSNMDAYREDLTQLLRRAKVILNIHAYPAKVLEICRILEAISFGIVVCALYPIDFQQDIQQCFCAGLQMPRIWLH